MKKRINVEEWVAMFRDIGLDEAKMKKWHDLFEKRHPEAHGEFLAWLGLPEDKIKAIRTRSQ